MINTRQEPKIKLLFSYSMDNVIPMSLLLLMKNIVGMRPAFATTTCQGLNAPALEDEIYWNAVVYTTATCQGLNATALEDEIYWNAVVYTTATCTVYDIKTVQFRGCKLYSLHIQNFTVWGQYIS